MKHRPGPDVLRDQAAALGVDLSPAAAGTLLRFEAALLERAIPGGMIAASDASRLRERHVLDCLRAAGVVRADDRTALDLGSGAGLPGMVVAIAVPTLSVTLVESRGRRAAFLELAVEQLGVANVTVAARRLEEVTGKADLCFARAFAPLPEAWTAAERLLRPSGRLVYFAGSGPNAPLGAAGARVLEVREAPLLESAGPLVIMAR